MHEDVFGLVGTTIDGRYRVDEIVGEGGFGVVYRGWHVRFDHAIAIKCLKVPPHFTNEAKRLFLENFRNEGKLLSALSGQHLSIVRVYDFGVTPTVLAGSSVPYLVLEWLVGRNLEVALEQRTDAYAERAALALLRPAVEAIATAHTSNPPIAHRDLKPANLFVGEGSSALLKVLDFGIAKAMQDGETATQVATRTNSGFSAFSPGFGAPEQFNPGKDGYGTTGPWTDVHALGLILVELVTGKPALDGTNYYALSMSAMSPTRPTPRARGVGPEVSDGFEALCVKALALRPADRYRSAAELLEAMDALTAAGTLGTADMGLERDAPHRAPTIAPLPTVSSAALPNTLASGLETTITIPRRPLFPGAARIRRRGLSAFGVGLVGAVAVFLAFNRDPTRTERMNVEQAVVPVSNGDVARTSAVSQGSAIATGPVLALPPPDTSMLEPQHSSVTDKDLQPAATPVAPTKTQPSNLRAEHHVQLATAPVAPAKTQPSNPRAVQDLPSASTLVPKPQPPKWRGAEEVPSTRVEGAAPTVSAAPEPTSAGSSLASKTAGHGELAEVPPRDEILTAMHKVESSVRLCALRASARGTAEATLIVAGATGRVTDVRVPGVHAAVASCIRRVMSTVRFPRFMKQNLSIKYLYQF